MKIKNFIIISIGFIVNLLLVTNLHLKCPWKSVLGIDCAGCGATRMLKALLKFDFYQAFRYNPLIFIYIIFGIIYMVYMLISILRKKKYKVLGIKFFISIILLTIVFMILRNIEIFNFLKPTKIR